MAVRLRMGHKYYRPFLLDMAGQGLMAVRLRMGHKYASYYTWQAKG